MCQNTLKCRICNSLDLIEFLSLGQMPIANAFISKDKLPEPEYFFHLRVGFCKKCYMVQLIDLVPKEKLFNANYAYFSSVSKTMESHFKNFTSDVSRKFLNDSNDLVVELGSNDGIMLKYYKKSGFRTLGIEPSANVADVARAKGIDTWSVFFNEETARKIVEEKGKAKAVVGANVICHIPDLHSLVRGIDILLDDDVVCIFEDPYLPDILSENAYDQVYDEHVYYFSITSLKNLFDKYGLEVFNSQRQSTHGGSNRIFVKKKGGKYSVEKKLIDALSMEKEIGLQSLEPYREFAKNVERSKKELSETLAKLKAEGKKICAYAASSKGTVVLNYCNVGTSLLDYVSDSTPTKQGLYMPGVHVPIVSPGEFTSNPPDYALLLAWNYEKEILEKEKEYRGKGGKFIIHVPYSRIV